MAAPSLFRQLYRNVGSFRVRVVWHVVLISLTLSALAWVLVATKQYLLAGLLLLLASIQIVRLIRLVETTNQKLQLFLESIRYSDFAASFTHDNRLGPSFRSLNEQFNAVINEFKKTRAEREENLRYLDTVVQHVGVGLIAFDTNGKIELLNQAARTMLHERQLRTLADLHPHAPELVDALLRTGPGGSGLVRLEAGNTERQVSIRATEFRMRGKAYKLVSLQDIQVELEQKELEAWRNLARVLRHEIMNSITPISSLSGTIRQMVVEEAQAVNGHYELDAEAFEDLQSGLATIEKRSQGLVHFVDAYRNFTSLPTPVLQAVPLLELCQRVELLMGDQLTRNGIQLRLDVKPTTITVQADPDLVEMVVLNLVKNAAEAFHEAHHRPAQPVIVLSAQPVPGGVALEVADNGPGIIPEAIEKIFIPFYSTKRGGSGIGLAWSRQVLHQHRGTLTVQSQPDHETVFTLRFPA